MSSLSGVVDEWDDSSVIRTQIRNYGMLLMPVHADQHPVPTIRCGELNFDALKPLVKRLRTPTGEVGMHSVPDLQRVTFGYQTLYVVFYRL